MSSQFKPQCQFMMPSECLFLNHIPVFDLSFGTHMQYDQNKSTCIGNQLFHDGCLLLKFVLDQYSKLN